ncbi:hypothetical protein Goshw_008083 [Gossypium schwendimanii]|uniref:Replication protein A C-terminal domain-containing protein n=1 Tax=Gossypium schwendimanii TaxID=34291 RepID=A0A7J9N6I0_GOSSC|nr:hypothetical protein [Gossypium schwendimanii]
MEIFLSELFFDFHFAIVMFLSNFGCCGYFYSLKFGVAFRPVIDFNEIANHFIECMYVHLYNTNLRVRVEAQVCKMTFSACTCTLITVVVVSWEIFDQHFSKYHRSDRICLKKTVFHSSQRIVNSFYVFSALEIGVPSDVMALELNVSYDKIRKYLEFLVFEGLVYMTIDDHYKFTDSSSMSRLFNYLNVI